MRKRAFTPATGAEGGPTFPPDVPAGCLVDQFVFLLQLRGEFERRSLLRPAPQFGQRPGEGETRSATVSSVSAPSARPSNSQYLKFIAQTS